MHSFAAGLVFVQTLAAFVLGCGGGGGSPTAPPPPAPVSPIAGRYDVAVALGVNSCGAVTVQTQPTSVTHSVGDSRFTLVHGGNTFSATLNPDSSFVTDPLPLAGGDGSTLSVRIAGRFPNLAIEATVTVDIRDRPVAPATCSYVVAWTGTKTG
ncbi:MAG: hypothetical protein ABIV06_11850 [Thermoanaerobaculia bacterium]